MIGADEYNVRSSQSMSQSASDISEMEFIETFLASSSREQIESGLLIDIVCPQPPSQRHRGLTGKNTQASQKNASTRRK